MIVKRDVLIMKKRTIKQQKKNNYDIEHKGLPNDEM